MNSPLRQIVAHSPFDEAETGAVRFKRTVAKGELKAEDPLWTDTDFEEHFATMRRLEAELQQIIGELEPKRIKWPEAASLASLPAYLSQAFFDRYSAPSPLALKEAERKLTSQDEPR